LEAVPHCHVSLTRDQQEATLTDIREAFPDYAAVHSHVLQDGLARLHTTSHAFFRRVANGKQPGFPRFHGTDCSHSFTDHGPLALLHRQGGGQRRPAGQRLCGAVHEWASCGSGRRAVRWSRPLQGTIQMVTRSNEAAGWDVSFCCAEVPIEPLPLTGKEPGIDVGLKVLLITAEGAPVQPPRYYRKAERG
jgi:putative transposase